MVETYRASSLPGRNRAAAWRELYSTHLDKVDITPADPEKFEAVLQLATLGPIRIARLLCDRSLIARSARHVAQTPGRVYTFILQTAGRGTVAHYGHEAALLEGDFCLCDSAAPHTYQTEDGSEALLLRVPSRVLRQHLPSPEYFCGRHLSSTQGLTSTAATVTTSLWRQIESGVSGTFQSRIARHLLDMLTTTYAMAFDSLISGSSVVVGRHAKVKLYIEQHLRDPDLSPCSIAQQLKLSPRYLRMIFATGSETVSAYILRRRLEECARQMTDPLWRGHSITEIAFAWGFVSAPHFTRSFRDRYGMSPRDYRRARLQAATQSTPEWPRSRAQRPALTATAA
jgi:AraC family transcriptional activator of tynA and feaB